MCIGIDKRATLAPVEHFAGVDAVMMEPARLIPAERRRGHVAQARMTDRLLPLRQRGQLRGQDNFFVHNLFLRDLRFQ